VLGQGGQVVAEVPCLNEYTCKTQEKCIERRSLKDNEIVRGAIKDLMLDFQLDRTKNCSKEEFVRVMMIIGTALRPNIEADELNELINHDFSEASQDKF